MTQEQLDSILQEPAIGDIISGLSVSTYTTPKWIDLKPQYDPTQHSILTDKVKYPIIPNEKGGDDMKRITRALQKLAVNRMSQAMGSTPVKRIYSYDRENKSQQKAVDIIEEVYRTQNYIDSENIERFKMNNASCQTATVWYVTDEENNVLGEIAKKKLNHVSYSPMDGYSIYANYDNNKKLLVISFYYTDSDGVEYFDTYTKNKYYQWQKDDEGWEQTKNETILFMPVVHTWISEPVWGGNTGTSQVEAIEETLSYRAVYIKKNAVPLGVLDTGDTTNMSESSESESDEDKRRILKVGKGGSLKYAVWDVNNGTSERQIKDMENAFFDDNQIPNISFSNLLDSRTSADNKDIMLTDSKSKAIDLGGEWERVFNYELNHIVIPFLKVIFPNYAQAFDSISVRSKLRPFSVKTDSENAEFVANAGSSMSLETKVKVLGKADDVRAEVEAIENEQNQQSNNLL